jgi:hypothetical protein
MAKKQGIAIILDVQQAEHKALHWHSITPNFLTE